MHPIGEMGMEIVARHLQEQAESKAPSHEGDLFGRSAFNRYYYAAYLEVRFGLSGWRPEWKGDMAHAKIPEILRGQVLRTLKTGLRAAERNSDNEVASLCSGGITAARELAQLMDNGRSARVTADYNPEIKVEFRPDTNFRLNTVGVHEARSWPVKARTWVNIISQAWRQVDE
ncbi:hypothetical protein [Undibacterium parvum]|uniref:Uncharacterized protein n=2 Tax=Undibacterium TaxID=401469 RepID=A0A6M3ZZR3_9BURK|nr:hypothetical protein [Undibacterium parvum]AZP13561.1 hypothetical protein EJN92_17140 [Undibacterium parvum]QJQ04561.1 hypothetical protein EJG51_000410 [Undibacterium piscinae]